MQHLRAFLDSFLDFSVTGCIRPRPPPDPINEAWEFPKADRLVALGDLHGDVSAAKRAFQAAGLIDTEERWVGGSTVCVQVGDLLDRGSNEIELLYWMEHVASEARKAGGKVIILNGNHEYLNVLGKFRYASEEGTAPFTPYMYLHTFCERLLHACGQPAAPPPPVPDTIPHEFRDRFAALRPGGPLAQRFLGDKNTVVRVGDTLFVHAGVLPEHVDYGLGRINAEAKAWVSNLPGAHMPRYLHRADSIVWTRLFSNTDQHKVNCDPLWQTFWKTGAARMVVGHTVHRAITAQCQGRVFNIDVGMSEHVSHREPQALEILHDDAVHAIRADGTRGYVRQAATASHSARAGF
eukprot:m.10922 g.10922  ORF g.10922 m.10922 type:complete len:351 (+) comp2575_c0_seq1:32-1084(+)